jgi:hypothetical protein
VEGVVINHDSYSDCTSSYRYSKCNKARLAA